MQTILRCLILIGLISIADSCAVRDHLAPETSSCRTTEFLGTLDYYLIPPGETVAIGQTVTSHLFNTIQVIDIVKVGDLSFAVGYPEYTITYEYDLEGRIKKTGTSGRLYRNERIFSEFSYAGNQVTEIRSSYNFRPDPFIETLVHPLNSDGVEENPNITYTNGLIAEQRFPSYTIKNTIENWNIVKSENKPENPEALPGLTTYEFDLTKSNPIPAFFPIFASPSRSKLNKNLLIKVTDDNQVGDGSEPLEVYYNYVKTDWGLFEIVTLDRPNDERFTYIISGYKLSCQ